MISGDEDVYMELAFVRENSVSQQEKVKAFWKFLDAQNCLQPHEGISERESPPEAEASVSSMEEIMKEKDIWRKGLGVFRRLGLDRTALAADDRCKLCLAHKTIQYDRRQKPILELSIKMDPKINQNALSDKRRCEDLADTVMQPYEELNADMEAFEQRQKSRDSSQRGAADESNRCDSKTKK